MDTPANFEQLRIYTYHLKEGDTQIGLGKKSLQALSQMIETPEIVATKNIVRLSRKLGLSPASITRISKLLGYSGFNQFQDLFRRRSELSEDFYSQKANRLKQLDSLPHKKILEKQLASSILNMQQCIANLDDNTLDLATRLLARARNVFVFGHKQASTVASVLECGLKLIRRNVNTLLQQEQGVALALGQIQPNDLVVLIGSAPYSDKTIQISSALKFLNCQVLVISDSFSSPLSEHATAAISVPTAGNFYNNSLAAKIILIESLMSLVAIELGQSAVARLQRHEALVRKLPVS